MTRDLSVHSAGWSIGIDGNHVFVRVVSKDLKAQPVHDIPLTQLQALKLAGQLIESVRFIEEKSS